MEDIRVYRAIGNEIRNSPSFNERWEDFELGLITAWESGRQHRDSTFKDIVSLLEQGALPKLSFKGGHLMPPYKDDKQPKYKYKYGVYNYLAQLQGILNQDLDIYLKEDFELVCKLTGLKTIFTLDIEKFKDRTMDKEKALTEMYGIAEGILADDEINQKEVEYLLNWIEDNVDEHDFYSYPFDEIHETLLEAMMDGVLSRDESEDIKKLLKSFVKTKTTYIKENDIAPPPFCESTSDIEFKNKVFCFTGGFKLGSRSECEETVIQKGSKISRGITKKVDYLVVGLNGSDDWAYGSYGTKIVKAMQYREQGVGISIVSEDHFNKYIGNYVKKEIEKGKYERKLNLDLKIEDSFVVFDLETTGFSHLYDEIIEIGAVKVDILSSTEHKIFSTLVKPYNKISKRITAINGIDNDMVADSDNIDIVIKEFYDFIGDLPLVAHNASFDMKFLIKNFEDNKLIFKNNEIIDTLSLAKKAYPDAENHKLTTLVKHIGIEVKQSHRAYDDALAAMHVYTTSMQILHGAYRQ